MELILQAHGHVNLDEKWSCSHDHGLNGDPMVMGGGKVENACQSLPMGM